MTPEQEQDIRARAILSRSMPVQDVTVLLDALDAERAARAKFESEHEACVQETADARDVMLDDMLTRAETAEARVAALEAALRAIVRINLRCDECSASHTIYRIAMARL